MASRHVLALGLLVMLSAVFIGDGAISPEISSQIASANAKGPYVAVATTDVAKLNALLESGQFEPDADQPYIIVSGTRFRFGNLKGLRVIASVLGHDLNAALSAELLLSLFEVSGFIVFGNAANADPVNQIGDVIFPRYWANTGVWNWEKFQNPKGAAPNDDMEVEAVGKSNATNYGILKIYKYNNPTSVNGRPVLNYLSKISYHAQQLFPDDNATTETQKKIFWVPTSTKYYKLATLLGDMHTELQRCVDESNCLPRNPVAEGVKRGSSATIQVNNAAYRDFLYSTFQVTPVDTSSAGVGFVCRKHRMHFIAFRALSNSGDGSNESRAYSSLVSHNLVTVVLKFISLLASSVQTM